MLSEAVSVFKSKLLENESQDLEGPNGQILDGSSENASAAKENSNDATVPEGDQVQPTKIPLDRASRPKKPPAKLASSTAEVKSGRKYVAKNQCGNCIYKKV